ncbi:MAG: TetR family transcriptional regulator [Negativicutes bacterium]|nr:TetR family transcriptional regulator [Negativicutes bacterium]
MREKDAPTKLLETATALFAQKGYAAVSIRQLAQAAGINSALISYYYGGKDGLYRAVLETELSRLASGVAAIVAANLPPLARLRRFAALITKLHHDSPYLLRLATSELTNPTACFETVVKPYIERNYQFLQNTLREGIEQGEIRADIDPAYGCLSLVGIINFYFIAKPLAGRLLPPAADHDYAYARQAIEIYLDGIRRSNP